MDDTDTEDFMSVEVCRECRRHAHFLFGDGEMSGEFFSQGQAMMIVGDYYQGTRISYRMIGQLIREALDSLLPVEISDEMEEGLSALGDRLEDGGFDDDDCMKILHDFLRTSFPETPVFLQ